MLILKTFMFVSKEWFCYGQGEDIIDCFADALTVADNLLYFDTVFDVDDTLELKDLQQNLYYYLCYDDEKDNGQKVFYGDTLSIIQKINNEQIEYFWLYPVSKAYKTKDLEQSIRGSNESYKRVKNWLGEDW